MKIEENPERIWLEGYGPYDRCWCDHDAWGDGNAVEYVRSDKLEELAAEAAEWEVRFWKRDAQADRLMQQRNKAEAALAEKDKEIAALREALEAMLEPYEDDLCRHDHHGYCQAHFLQEDCCVAKARATLVRNAGGKDG